MDTEAPSSDQSPLRSAMAQVGAAAGPWIAWWFEPIRRREPWLGLLYVFTGLVTAPFWLAGAAVFGALALAFGLSVIGLPVAVGLLVVFARLTGLERRRAHLVGRDVEARPFRPGPFLGRLTDPAIGRPFAAAYLGVFVWAGLFVLGAGGWALSIYLVAFPLWGWAVGVDWGPLVVFLLAGVAVSGLAGRMSALAGDLGGRYVEWLLGPDPTAELQQRVDTLTENRQEILDAVAGERRRIERNLHDGVQQGLVAMGIDMSLAARMIEDDPEGARLLIEQAQDKARASIGELRLLGRGLHPAILGDRGLDAALSSVVGNAPIPVSLRYDVSQPLHADIAEAAYFVVNEAVGNVLKHAGARTAAVEVAELHRELLVAVHDDGVGGAHLGSGTGLSGLSARVKAVDGRLDVDSPPGGPTTITATMPLRFSA